LFEHRLHLRTQPVEAAAHIGDSGGDPDARPSRKVDHRVRISSKVRLDPTLDPDAPLRQFDVQRSGTGWFSSVALALLRRVHHRHRQQARAIFLHCEPAFAMLPSPQEQAVRVDAVGVGDLRYRRSHLQRLLEHPALLLRRIEPPLPAFAAHSSMLRQH
jgi:hypothetical protein